MIIPTNIAKEHLLKAIIKIDKEGIPKDGDSQYYDVIYKGKRYPPKLIVSFANIFANGNSLDRNLFSGGIDTPCFKLLEENAFVIEKKTEKMENSSKIWIEKTHVSGRNDRLEGDRALGKAIWSPRADRRGGDIYKNMRLVKAGDIILHLIDDRAISGISMAKKSFVETTGTKGTDWNVPAYLVELDSFTILNPAIDRKSILNEKNRVRLNAIAKTSEVFYNRELKFRQGAYLTPCPKDLLILINNIYKTSSGKDLPFIEMIDFDNEHSVETVNKLNFTTEKEKKYYLSIKTKPFIILAGLSGTGKSRLVRTLAYQFNNIQEDKTSKKNPPSNFQLIKVKPNWHDSSDLLGYESRISGKDRLIITDFIRFIVKAWQYPSTPFFLCLDEMNLAPVEQYFAEYLSVIETRRSNGSGKIVTDPILSGSLIKKYANNEGNVDKSFNLWKELEIEAANDLLKENLKTNGIGLPENLIVMGTVNMDETTHSFSRKVLDRAMTIEMNEIDLSSGLENTADEWNYVESPRDNINIVSERTQGYEVFLALGKAGGDIIKYLDDINIILENSPFKIAYRVRDEFLLYAYNYSLIENKPEKWLSNVLDDMTLMKILPRIEGDEEKTKLLDLLIKSFEEKNLPKSLQKANEMTTRRRLSHYTSFWS